MLNTLCNSSLYFPIFNSYILDCSIFLISSGSEILTEEIVFIEEPFELADSKVKIVSS